MKFKSKMHEWEVKDETVISIIKLVFRFSYIIAALIIINASEVTKIVEAWPQ